MMRRAIRDVLDRQEGIEVVGTAANGREALDKIGRLRPDVVTLDIDMPVMNGITTVKNIMIRHRTPVVMISSLVEDGYFAFEALRLGVMDFIPKPSRIHGGSWKDDEELLTLRVRIAASMQVQRLRRVRLSTVRSAEGQGSASPPSTAVAVGTTLAGPNSIMHVVSHLPRGFQGSVIAIQEIHPRILKPFCRYFNEISPVEVVPLIESTPLRSGKVYMGSTLSGARLHRSQTDGSPWLRLEGPRDAPIDELFTSAADIFGRRACGILLTGLGVDGTDGMRRIRAAGGLTLGQDHECCVYPNLVQHAVDHDAVDALLSNRGIARRIVTWTRHLR
ncbi:MAG: response regulator [Syntrophobacteraceae bacterium]|nr:response regulator [Syntrophobacteraceae bacterium]